MRRLEFDEPTHTYRVDGRVVPSVTTILKPLVDFGFVKAEVLEAKRELGRAVHRVCELHDLGRLDPRSVHEKVGGYYAGYLKFLRDYAPKWEGIEERVYHPRFNYCGTLDRRGRLEGFRAILDVKATVALSPVTGLQTAAYAEAYVAENPDAPGIPPHRRYALQLTPEGMYVLREYTDPGDIATFYSLVNITNWKNRYAKN